MTDEALSTALTQSIVLEKSARARWQAAPTIAEREAALLVVRHITAVIRALEEWIVARSTVAQT